MTPQQLNRLEKQLQQNHVDIQRLWKAAVQFPQPYGGIPMTAIPGGLTTDTTPTTTTTTTHTTTTTTRTLPPPDPCDGASFDVTVFWSPTIVCDGIPHCPTATTISARTLSAGTGSSAVILSPCPNPYTGGSMSIRISAFSYRCLVSCTMYGPYCGTPGTSGQIIYEGAAQVLVGGSFILSRIWTSGAGCYSCLPTAVIATRTM